MATETDVTPDPALTAPEQGPGSGTFAGNFRAVSLMLTAAAIWSLVPLVIDVSGGTHTPFMFNSGWRFGGVVGSIIYLMLIYRATMFDLASGQNRQAALIIGEALSFRDISWRERRFHLFGFLFGIVGKFEYAMFGLATQFAAVSVVAVSYEIWPLIMVTCMALLFGGGDRYQKTGVWIFSMFALCFVGFYLINIPDTAGDFQYWSVVLSIGAAFLGGTHNAVLFKWASDLSGRLQQAGATNLSAEDSDIFASIGGHTLAQLICAGMSFGIAYAIAEPINWSTFGWAMLGGAISTGIADISFRKANLISNNLGVNAISYTTPIFALVWLAIFSTISITRADYFTIGVVIIIMTNLLVNFEAEIRFGFRSLILALGVFGLVVYLRDDILNLLNVADWRWGTPEYFASVGMSGTVFTLLLAFRTGRIVSRTDAEENRIFAVFRRLELLAERGVIDSSVLECILRIDKPQNYADLQAAYSEARTYMTGVTPLNDADRQMLSEAEADLDALVRSRQSAIVLGELFALIIFAGITVFLAIFAHPMSNDGWARFLIDLFAMMVSPVIIFLLVNVWDLHRERDAGWLHLDAESNDYVVRFPDNESRLADQWVSVGIGVAIVGTFAALIANKWLGWFG